MYMYTKKPSTGPFHAKSIIGNVNSNMFTYLLIHIGFYIMSVYSEHMGYILKGQSKMTITNGG